MKRYTMLALGLFLAFSPLSGAQTQTGLKSPKAHHVVIIWLKQHGDDSARKQYIEGSKRLAKLPGVLAYNIGTPAAVNRQAVSPALDNSYDVAVSSTFKNVQALENYLKHPLHHQVVQDVLKPLVEKYQAYDFVE